MKKQLLCLFALIMSIGAFAQSADVILPTTVEFDPWDEDGYYLPSVNEVIHVEMDKVPNVPVTIMYVTGNSFGIDMKYQRITVTDKSFDIKLNRENWGIPYNQMFILNLAITFTYGEGDELEYYLNEEDEPIFFTSLYFTEDEGAAEYVATYPNGEWEKYFTFADAYKDGTVSLFFTKEVTHEASIGTITYLLKDGDEKFASIEDVVSEWSVMDGLYMLSFSIASDLTANQIETIIISFNGISNAQGILMIPELILENDSYSPMKLHKNNTSGLMMSTVATDVYDVYSITGVQIKKEATSQEINNLPSGMYIINGKKVSVR